MTKMMDKFSLKDLKKYSVYLTHNFPAIQTKRYKIGISKLAAYLGIYTLVTIIIVILLFIFTPAQSLLFMVENEELQLQSKRIMELENKLIILTKELESISSTNQKLKYAIILAGTDSLDSTAAIYDSLRETNNDKLRTGGNVLEAYRKLFNIKYELDSNKSLQSFLKPASGFVINQFNKIKGHLGIDFAVKTGSPVYASSGGLVIFSDYTVDDGNMIIISHDNDYITIYKHCSALLKKERDIIVLGELIALSGNTGYNTTGPHLHFEIWKNGKAIDPLKILTNI
jgi:lipoprotein NlpD